MFTKKPGEKLETGGEVFCPNMLPSSSSPFSSSCPRQQRRRDACAVTVTTWLLSLPTPTLLQSSLSLSLSLALHGIWCGPGLQQSQKDTEEEGGGEREREQQRSTEEFLMKSYLLKHVSQMILKDASCHR